MNDLIYSRRDVINLMLGKMIQDPVKVITDLWGQLDSRHL